MYNAETHRIRRYNAISHRAPVSISVSKFPSDLSYRIQRRRNPSALDPPCSFSHLPGIIFRVLEKKSTNGKKKKKKQKRGQRFAKRIPSFRFSNIAPSRLALIFDFICLSEGKRGWKDYGARSIASKKGPFLSRSTIYRWNAARSIIDGIQGFSVYAY